ncbi:MAG TPA: B-box zinc finger protein [Thermoanaerobaculia bacterium]|nr:B-box zinc finger protein [Thermoanaerobaculia bacterium]
MISTLKSSGARTCAYHSDRPAHALCVSCRTPLCRGCATPWEGIFLCASCLAARRTAAERRGSFWGWAKLALGIAAAAALAVFLGAWMSGLWAELLAAAGS